MPTEIESESDIRPKDWFLAPPKWVALVGIALIVLGIAFAGYRTYANYSFPDGSFEFDNAGLSDFHNGGYSPARAFRDGVNPYSVDASEKYNMARASPPYSPVVFMLHLPYTYFEVTQADIAFFVTNVLMIGLIGWFCISMTGRRMHWSWCSIVFGLLLFSRPGHITLFTGYFTAMMVIGTLVAIHFADRKPVLSGLGMVLASLKPTYILPLIVLMLCRRNFKATVWGIVFCAIGAGAGLGWLASHSSIEAVVQGVKEGQEAFHDDETEAPKNTWTRLDTVGVVAKLIHKEPGNTFYLGAMLISLIPPGVLVWKISKHEANRSAAGLSAMIVAIAMLITIYHHSYDCLLVSAAWFAVTFGGQKICCDLKTVECRALSILLGIPAINYCSTMRFREAFEIESQSLLWNAITSINGVCLLLSLLVLLGAAWRVAKKRDLATVT